MGKVDELTNNVIISAYSDSFDAGCKATKVIFQISGQLRVSLLTLTCQVAQCGLMIFIAVR